MKQSNNDRNSKGDLVVERSIDTTNNDSDNIETMSKAVFTEGTILLWQEIKEEAMKSIEQQNIERDSLRSEDEMSAIAELEIKRKIKLRMKRRDSRAIAVTKRIKNVENQEEEKQLHFDLQAATLTPLCKDIGKETIEEENPISTNFNANDLFDFSTLNTKSDSLNNRSRGVSNIKLKREKVKLQRLVLLRNGVEMQEDEFVLLEISEKPKRKELDPLKLNISRNCTNGIPLMPLNRSRNKDADNDYSSYKKFKYGIKKDLTKNNQNRPFVRTGRIARVSFRISDTSCLVDVYGTNINGRLFGGKGTGQNIQMNIFSFWNCQKYSLSFTIGDVRRLFIDRPDLIKAGCKSKIIDGLLKRLYFKYTVTATPPSDLDDKSVHVIEVTHLEKPKFPSFLHSSSIMDVITIIQDGQELVHLEQELKIGVEERPNGLVKRLSEYKETQRQLDELEKTKNERWFAKPKRLRGYLCSHLIRMRGHFVMITTYRMPDRPNNIIVKGVKAITCTKIGHYLGIPYLGQIFNIKQSSKNWDEDYIKLVVRKALRSMTLSAKVVFDEIRRKEYSLCIVDNNGTGVDFDGKSINRRRAFRLDTTRIHTTSDSFLNLNIPPRRHIGTTHLTTRAMRIDTVYCIYSVYIKKGQELTVEDESSFKSENKKAFTSEAFALEFFIYIPDDAYFKGSLIPGQSSFKITLDKEDVFFFTEAANLPILKSSLKILARHFFLNSDKDIVDEVKSNWQFLCAQLMERMQFRLRWHSTTATTIHEANQKMFIDARSTIEKPFDEGTIVCLSFRIGVVINKTVVIQSMDEKRQKPYVQCSLWVTGKSMGVIIYDFLKKNVRSMVPSHSIQDNQIKTLSEISSKDRVLQASMFLQFSLVLACAFDELTGEQCASELQWVNSE